ncbi:DNA mismatch repair endonuclease MutL [Sedimentibacter sp.]|uniref:DNA mismatch repair endonuclease MutL n=1 Tax=Sedimentibacter sp. TaxID=1960295 RepID=UPI002899EE16|nr:DNA mismatch repair endonuclease MutL [Sedimentibacter sp.]
MAKIHLLDNETINKIAAGEVIESPKSIVKELVENSIDAGADEITVEIKNGGKSLIRITDNGKGIERDEVEDAFKRHCTSKISTSDDLNTLYTLGFRGEALASIASVSHVELITRTADDNYGTKISLTGGEIVSKEDIGCPVGTIITVTDLFFNVPARKKFLKSDASESGSINEIVVSLALSKENISFKYINSGNVVFRTPKTNNFLNTISSLYEKDLYNSLLKVNYENNGIIITGFTTNLNYYRGTRKQQIVFVNSRLIKHKRINYFIEAAYNTLLPKDKYPACFLKIEIDPSLVDVNVHPAKTEIRFQNEDNVLNEVKRAVYSALNANNIMKEVRKETIVHDYTDNKVKNNLFEIFEKNDIKPDVKKDVFDYNNDDYTNIKITEVNIDKSDKEKINIFDDAIDKIKDSYSEQEIKTEIQYKTEVKDEQVQESFIEISKSESKLPELSVAGILMDTYIICENIEKTEMYMIDQHAAHERINYERFLNQYNNREILLQEMIVPEVINLSYDDYQTTMNNAEIFSDLGFFIENFGINAILINSIPSIFKNSNIKDIFYTILDSLKNTSNINLELDKIIKNACVKSVKAGDRLHLLEVKALLSDLGKTDNPYTCPHGRPVIIKMTKYEIERMFERIQN